MHTVQIVFNHEGTHRYQVSKIDGELIGYKDVTNATEDPDYWLTSEDVQRIILNPLDGMPNEATTMSNLGAEWTVEVATYSVMGVDFIDSKKLQSVQKAARKKELLDRMTPEDRALFS